MSRCAVGLRGEAGSCPREQILVGEGSAEEPGGSCLDDLGGDGCEGAEQRAGGWRGASTCGELKSGHPPSIADLLLL